MQDLKRAPIRQGPYQSENKRFMRRLASALITYAARSPRTTPTAILVAAAIALYCWNSENRALILLYFTQPQRPGVPPGSEVDAD